MRRAPAAAADELDRRKIGFKNIHLSYFISSVIFLTMKRRYFELEFNANIFCITRFIVGRDC